MAGIGYYLYNYLIYFRLDKMYIKSWTICQRFQVTYLNPTEYILGTIGGFGYSWIITTLQFATLAAFTGGSG